MLSVNIVCIGKLKEPWLRDGCAEYIKRLGPHCRLSVTELDEYRLPSEPSDAQIRAALADEGTRILKSIAPGSYKIALCIEGDMLPSTGLAQALASLAVSGVSDISFIIGGSHGLSDAVKQESRMRLSISPMTFPHQLSRLILLEQLYRAFSINASGKYHK